jgi:cytochrome c-type biogenesis protein
MNSSIFFGGSVTAAVIAGVIALFAPCCISVMLPAYLAGSFQNRRVLVAMTFVFATGIATVILPLTLGASALRQLFVEGHRPIYIGGGLLMLGLAGYTLLGGQLHLPMPGRRAGGRAGPLGVYSLGVFSGVATSCCAPVLAGVIALSGVTASFALALGLGAAYVFGMVAPLFVIALLWERFDWRSSRLFRPRNLRWRLGPLRRSLPATSAASGLLLAAMGAVTLWLGATRSSMAATTGWQATLTVRLEHAGHLVTDALSWAPGWLMGIVLAVGVALLAWRALGQVAPSDESGCEACTEGETADTYAETTQRQHESSGVDGRQ